MERLSNSELNARIQLAEDDQEIQQLLDQVTLRGYQAGIKGRNRIFVNLSDVTTAADVHANKKTIKDVVVPAMQRAHIPHRSIPENTLNDDTDANTYNRCHFLVKRHERRAIRVFRQDPFLIRLGLPPKERKIPFTELYRRDLIRQGTLIRYTSSFQGFLAKHDIHLESKSISDLYEGIADNPVVFRFPHTHSKKSRLGRFDYRVDASVPQVQELLVQIKDRLANIPKEEQIGKMRARLIRLAPYIDILKPNRAWVLRQRLAGLHYDEIVKIDALRRSEDALRALASRGLRQLEEHFGDNF